MLVQKGIYPQDSRLIGGSIQKAVEGRERHPYFIRAVLDGYPGHLNKDFKPVDNFHALILSNLKGKVKM